MIRPFEKKDLQQCLEMSKQQHQESIWNELPFELEKVKWVYLNCIGHPKKCALVIEKDGNIIGCFVCQLVQYNFSYNSYVTDIWFYIKPEHRKGFLSIDLYKAVYQWAKEKSALEVIIGHGIDKNNKKMESFYNRLGYKHHLDYYRKPVIA